MEYYQREPDDKYICGNVKPRSKIFVSIERMLILYYVERIKKVLTSCTIILSPTCNLLSVVDNVVILVVLQYLPWPSRGESS